MIRNSRDSKRRKNRKRFFLIENQRRQFILHRDFVPKFMIHRVPIVDWGPLEQTTYF